ncbi:sigma-70 family RNA polymerase sigma factor [Chthoniobacter flavus]|nr:sigma-70 family RNA polymerase sigma factor [Chthoniobacter flavus]
MKISAEQIWNEFSGRLGQFIRGRVNDPTVAEDILHEVFAKYQVRCDEFRDPAKVQGWLFLVARNAVIDHYRSRKPTSEVTESLAAEPPQTLEIAELHAAFQQLIDSLPEPYREVIVLAELDGLTQAQLAKRLGISLSAAKSRVQRGREKLKELLLDFCQREFRCFGRHSPCPNGLIPPPEEAKKILQQMRAERKTRSRE